MVVFGFRAVDKGRGDGEIHFLPNREFCGDNYCTIGNIPGTRTEPKGVRLIMLFLFMKVRKMNSYLYHKQHSYSFHCS